MYEEKLCGLMKRTDKNVKFQLQKNPLKMMVTEDQFAYNNCSILMVHCSRLYSYALLEYLTFLSDPHYSECVKRGMIGRAGQFSSWQLLLPCFDYTLMIKGEM